MMSTPGNPNNFKERDGWICALLGADLPYSVRVIGALIGYTLRVSRGECTPVNSELAAQARVSVRTVIRTVAVLERTDWIAVERKDGCRNGFVLTIPRGDKVLSPLIPTKAVSPLTKQGGDSGVTPTRDKAVSPPPVTHAVTHKERKRTKKESGDIYPPPDRSADSSKKSAEEEKNLFGETAATGSRVADAAAAFDRFWAIYPKRIREERARKAFAKAVKDGTDPELIIEGAKRYAASERERLARAREPGQEQYTRYPANWLRDREWNEPLPSSSSGGKVIDGATGEIIRTVASRRRSAPMTWEEVEAQALANVYGEVSHERN
jgi:hypothetical protein